MSEKIKVKINEEFRPAPQLKKLYWIYFVLAIFLGVLWWCIPVILFAPPVITVCISLPIVAVLIFTAYWIPKYYDSIVYKLTENEIIWKRGVWFKNTGIVPYNRITNIDITQGPISRKLGIAALKIQTAGYSGQQARSEIRINGIEDFEELREVIMGFVKGKKPVAVETYEEENIDSRILNEVVRIRKLLEKYSKTR
ncbi:MAG: PH domain-containing protein [Methanomicrobia archaeon]|nr:PH domain-containing protein [Methanomicrobia archaeon]